MSLLYRLKNDKKVDRRIFSIYISDDHNKKSTIKFGGWDQAGIATGQSLEMFQSKMPAGYKPIDWDLSMKSVSYGSTVLTSEKRYARIDPYYPMIHIPDVEYDTLQKGLISSFGSEIVCNYNMNYCKFNKACKDVTIKTDGDISFEITDDIFTKTYTLKMQDLLFAGEEFGDPNTCYYGVFASKANFKFSYFLG